MACTPEKQVSQMDVIDELKAKFIEKTDDQKDQKTEQSEDREVLTTKRENIPEDRNEQISTETVVDSKSTDDKAEIPVVDSSKSTDDDEVSRAVKVISNEPMGEDIKDLCGSLAGAIGDRGIDIVVRYEHVDMMNWHP